MGRTPRRTRWRTRVFQALLLAALLAPFLPAAVRYVPPPPSRARVVFVADGDTLRVAIDGRKEWIRLLRIDTPEKDEQGYRQAREELVGMAGGREVTLLFERDGVVERDDYGRILAYVFHGKRHLNVDMVKAGWSVFWTRYGEGRFARQFREAEAAARKSGRGLWSGSRQDPTGRRERRNPSPAPDK